MTTPNVDNKYPEAPQKTLPFNSYNPSGTSTILLIHGAFVTAHDWDPVISHIPTTYHILAPDLPAHGRAAGLTFTVASAAEHLATLIQHEAHNSAAHIVGLSMGAHVAAHLASHYPDRALTVFATGFSIMKPSFMSPVLPSLFYSMQSATDMVPRSLVGWAMDGADVGAAQKGVVTKALCAEILRMFRPESVREDVGVVKVRVLVIAATKSGIVPSGDSVEAAKVVLELAKGGWEGCVESRVVKHPQMRHPWNKQDPKLFAEAVVAWAERGDLVEGFEEI